MGQKIEGQVFAQQFGRWRKGSGNRDEEPGSWKRGRETGRVAGSQYRMCLYFWAWPWTSPFASQGHSFLSYKRKVLNTKSLWPQAALFPQQSGLLSGGERLENRSFQALQGWGHIPCEVRSTGPQAELKAGCTPSWLCNSWQALFLLCALVSFPGERQP